MFDPSKPIDNSFDFLVEDIQEICNDELIAQVFEQFSVDEAIRTLTKDEVACSESLSIYEADDNIYIDAEDLR